MKSILYYWGIICLLSVMPSCSSEGSETDLDLEEITEVARELKLSIPLINETWIYTDEVDYEFEILDGNGDYRAVVTDNGGDPSAFARVEGNKVIVSLLDDSGCSVTVWDKKGKSAVVYIQSTHESLVVVNHTYFVEVGDIWEIKGIDFGVGKPYTIERVKGDASEIEVKDGKMYVTAKALGNTDYKFRDKRGTVMSFRSVSSLQFDVQKGETELGFDAANYMSATVTLKWGKEWKIIDSSNIISYNISLERPYVVGGGLSEFYTLFLNTKEEGKGTDFFLLRNSDNEEVTVSMSIQ
ncbi:MAG: hypothetical protein ACRDD8_00955 [Bacteroidales bacterium]